MKRKLTSTLKVALLFALFFPYAHAALAQTTVTFSKPRNSMYYDFDGTSWLHKRNYTYTYNNDGLLITSVSVDPVTNVNLYKNELTHDVKGHLASSFSYTWQNNNWVLTSGFNRIITYNALGKPTEEITQFTRNGVLANESKYTYTYDTAGNLLEDAFALWRNNAWLNQSKNTYTYVNGERTERLLEFYNPSANSWYAFRKTIYAGWQTLNDKYTSAIDQELDGTGNWKNTVRSTLTLGQYGTVTDFTEVYQNGTWVPAMRQLDSFDAHGNKIGLYLEDFINGAWKMKYDASNIYTYNAQNDLLERRIQDQDTIGGPKRDRWKEVYSNHQYFTRVLGTSEQLKTEISLNIFPNPATDKIQIELTGLKLQALTITVSDITGKTWLNKTFKAAEGKQLNIEALPNGIYLLQLQTEAGATVKRIVKQ